MAMQDKTHALHAGDWVIIAGYFVLCIGVGLFSKFRKQRGKPETSEGYFLAGRSMMWWAVGPSLFASNIGSKHFVGLAGTGAATGIAVVAWEWQAAWCLLLLGWAFVPIYIKSRVFTMPEFLKKRFQSGWIRTYLTALSIFSYLFTRISVDIYAGSVFLYEAVGWNIYISAAVILAITAIYTLLGGLKAVVFTDVLQCVIMIIGAIVLSILSFIRVGGYDGLWSKYKSAYGKPYRPAYGLSNATLINITAYNTSNSSSAGVCYKSSSYWNHMIRPLDDPDYPWLGLWTALPMLGVSYWCTEQLIVQRVLAAKNQVQAKAGTVFAGLLKLLPMFLMVMPGMISRVLFPDSIACADEQSCLHYCGNKWGCTNNAYPKLVVNVLPTGLVGLMMAVMMAAIMSSLSSAFNSCATIFTVDVWLVFRPHAKDREKLIFGRIIVMILAGLSLVWLPIIQGARGGQLYEYTQSTLSYVAPPSAMVFSLGILWPRLTKAGALSGLLVGFFMGMLRFILDRIYRLPECGQSDLRPAFVKLHFMYYAMVIFGVSGVIMVVVSLFTKPVPREELGGLTWFTINDPPIATGGIGEEGVQELDNNVYIDDKENDNFKLLEVKDDVEQVEQVEKEEDGQTKKKKSRPVAKDRVYLEVVLNEEESFFVKWTLRFFTVFLLIVVIFLWVYFR